jgi:PhnB protein
MNESSGCVVEFGSRVDGITLGRPEHRGLFGQPQLLREHVKQAFHRIVLFRIRQNDEAIAAQPNRAAAANIDFEASGFDAIAGHLNHQVIRRGLVHGPFQFRLHQNVGRKSWKSRASRDCEDHREKEKNARHEYHVTRKNVGVQSRGAAIKYAATREEIIDMAKATKKKAKASKKSARVTAKPKASARSAKPAKKKKAVRKAAAPKIDPLNRKGYGSVSPNIIVSDVRTAMNFLTTALGFKVKSVMDSPYGIMHAELMHRGTTVMLSPESRQHNNLTANTIGNTPVTLYLLVENVDDVFAKAVAAGGKVTMPVMDMFWGDRCGTVADADGNKWMIATHKSEPTEAEMAESMRQMMQQSASAGGA